ncbi:MAG: M56 family metallopeptidase [Actinobacteria bacterium]|nr:M56 family metallopeptidase [Actinomycetota bacterium]
MFFLTILSNYPLPIIYDSAVGLIIALVILAVFRIKDPNIRILFFMLPLLKPFLIIIEKVDVNELYFQTQTFKGTSGIRFPDPSGIIKFDDGFRQGPKILFSNPNYIILAIILSAIMAILIVRWTTLALFFRRLAYEEKVTRKEAPEFYGIIDDFISKTKTSSPDISLTHKNYISPFIVGVRRFTLVISPGLLERLNRSEKETLIQHELSHIKRKDNKIGWLALILKDLNFFNPFAYISYSLIRSEQEKACDRLVVEYSGKSPKEIAKDVLNSILKLNLVLSPTNHLIPMPSSTFSLAKIFNQKRLENRINSIINTDPAKIYSRLAPKILMALLFLFFLFIQIMFVFKIGNIIFVLR